MSVATAIRATARRKGRDHSAIARKFEDDVLARRFPCCTLFRAAIERQRRDLESPPVGYVWRPDLGDKACRFMDMLPCAEGMNRGEPIAWQPWQVWLFRTFFGWTDTIGAPRFRFLSAWLPKGNGKSPMAAAIALYIEATAKGGEKSFSAATTAKQARAVWSHAQEMLRLAPKIAERFRLVPGEHAIKGDGDNRCYEPVSAEAGSIEGIRPEGVVILDEVHVLPNRKLYDNLKSAVNKCFTGRLVNISTAGFDMSPGALARELYCRARDILLRKIEDETTLALIAEADLKRPDGTPTDPFSIEAIREANPNLDVSVSLAGLLSEAKTAQTTPSERPSYEVKHLGWWQQTAQSFIQPALWNALADGSLSLGDLTSEWTVTAGVDLARTRDLTAVVLLASRLRDDGKREYRVFTRLVYLAEESPTLRLLPDLRAWAKGGWLTLLPGNTTGYAQVKEDIVKACQPFPGVEVCFDDWCAAEMEQDLTTRGLLVVSIRQGAKTQSEPMKELEAAVLDGRLAHDGSPVAAMCIGNLVARPDRNGNIAPDRENEYKKIDVAVALVNAMSRAMVRESPVYTPDRGLFCVDFDDADAE
jgi:phage terminase large subunit-like protein